MFSPRNLPHISTSASIASRSGVALPLAISTILPVRLPASLARAYVPTSQQGRSAAERLPASSLSPARGARRRMEHEGGETEGALSRLRRPPSCRPSRPSQPQHTPHISTSHRASPRCPLCWRSEASGPRPICAILPVLSSKKSPKTAGDCDEISAKASAAACLLPLLLTPPADKRANTCRSFLASTEKSAGKHLKLRCLLQPLATASPHFLDSGHWLLEREWIAEYRSIASSLC